MARLGMLSFRTFLRDGRLCIDCVGPSADQL